MLIKSACLLIIICNYVMRVLQADIYVNGYLLLRSKMKVTRIEITEILRSGISATGKQQRHLRYVVGLTITSYGRNRV